MTRRVGFGDNGEKPRRDPGRDADAIYDDSPIQRRPESALGGLPAFLAAMGVIVLALLAFGAADGWSPSSDPLKDLLGENYDDGDVAGLVIGGIAALIFAAAFVRAVYRLVNRARRPAGETFDGGALRPEETPAKRPRRGQRPPPPAPEAAPESKVAPKAKVASEPEIQFSNRSARSRDRGDVSDAGEKEARKATADLRAIAIPVAMVGFFALVIFGPVGALIAAIVAFQLIRGRTGKRRKTGADRPAASEARYEGFDPRVSPRAARTPEEKARAEAVGAAISGVGSLLRIAALLVVGAFLFFFTAHQIIAVGSLFSDWFQYEGDVVGGLVGGGVAWLVTAFIFRALLLRGWRAD